MSRKASGCRATGSSAACRIRKSFIGHAAVQSGRHAPLAGIDHALHRPAGADPSRFCRRRTFRRPDTVTVVVGWAKARCAVPTTMLGMVGTLRFAHPTILVQEDD